MNSSIVFLVDDDQAVRTSLALLLESEGFTVRPYASGEEFLAAYQEGHSGCLILDLRMPGMNGLEVQAELIKRGIRLPIVFLTAYGDIPTTVGAIKAGAEDFMTKPPDFGALIDKVKSLIEKSRQARVDDRETEELRGRLNVLTAREKEILGMAISGQSSKGIAQQLGLSQRTVENHRLRINKKLHTGNLLEFYHRAARCGIEMELPGHQS